MSLAAVGAELRRTARLARSYWLEYAADLLLYSLGFLLLITVFRAASSDYGAQGILSTLIGYATWKICASVLTDIAHIASEEARTGTLEQLFLSGLSTGRVFAGRSLGIILNHLLRGLVLAMSLASILNVLPEVSWLALLLFVLTLVGACGLGFALAGLVLVYKRIGGGLQLLWQMLVFFTGALAPIENPLLAGFARLLPLTLGITGLREVMLNGASASQLWYSGLLPGLLLNSSFYVIFGVIVFNWGQHQARTLGVLSHY